MTKYLQNLFIRHAGRQYCRSSIHIFSNQPHWKADGKVAPLIPCWKGWRATVSKNVHSSIKPFWRRISATIILFNVRQGYWWRIMKEHFSLQSLLSCAWNTKCCWYSFDPMKSLYYTTKSLQREPYILKHSVWAQDNPIQTNTHPPTLLVESDHFLISY